MGRGISNVLFVVLVGISDLLLVVGVGVSELLLVVGVDISDLPLERSTVARGQSAHGLARQVALHLHTAEALPLHIECTRVQVPGPQHLQRGWAWEVFLLDSKA